jgi:hypothetical protein
MKKQEKSFRFTKQQRLQKYSRINILFYFQLIVYNSGSQTVGRDPQGGREGLERGAQHTFL